MLSLPQQLRRAQQQLQGHRTWLSTFRDRSGRGRTGISVAWPVRWFTAYRELHERDARSAGKTGGGDGGPGTGDGDGRGPTLVRNLPSRRPDEERASTHLRSKAKERKRERYENRKLGGKQTVEDKALVARHELLDLLGAPEKASLVDDIKGVIRLYSTLPKWKPLTSEDFRTIAQNLHQALRLESQKPAAIKRREDTETIIAFAELLVNDVRAGNLIPSYRAHLHLLGIFKESGHLDAGIDFWKWLETQDNEYVRAETYGIAIEILAMQGTPLAELEALYQRALAQANSSFATYHFSPEAIVPDREGPFGLQGLPRALLHSITFARLLRGDSHNAYLALDVSLRLFPHTTNARTFQLFIQERPLSEAYTAFAIASRAGITLPITQFRQLLNNIRTNSDLSTVSSHLAAARVMIAMIYLQLGTSGSLPSNSIGELIVTLLNVFKFTRGMSSLEAKQRKKIVDASLLTVRRVLEVFARYGCLPPRSAFHTVITNIAGFGRSKEVLGIVLKDMDALGVKANEVTRRAILSVAGYWQDPSMIESSWKDIVAARQAAQRGPDATDFATLAKSCRAVSDLAYAQKQYEELKQHIPEAQRSQIEWYVNLETSQLDDQHRTGSSCDFDELHKGFQAVNADLAIIEESTRDSPMVQDFSEQQVPLTLFPPNASLRASEENMRRIYDEMTTISAADIRTKDPSPPEPVSEQTELLDNLSSETTLSNDGPKTPDLQSRSATGFNLGQLRYENWKAINYMLHLSEKHDTAYERLVDEAIAKGQRPPSKAVGFTKSELEALSDFGLSQPARKRGKEASLEEARAEIRRLRGRTVL